MITCAYFCFLFPAWYPGDNGRRLSPSGRIRREHYGMRQQHSEQEAETANLQEAIISGRSWSANFMQGQ